MFFYEKWDVFRAALELRRIATDVSRFRQPGTAADLDQFRRAASSVILNIAEGAKERHKGRKLVRYDTARASAGECNAAVLILLTTLPNDARVDLDEGQSLANRVSAMMTNLIRSVETWDDVPPRGSDRPTPSDPTSD